MVRYLSTWHWKEFS